MNEEVQKMLIQARLKEIEKEIEELNDEINKKDTSWDFSKTYDEYWEFVKPENEKIAKLDREKRMITPYILSDLSDYGDVMPLKEFIENVKNGCFIDYDGHGRYVKDGKETNIVIRPSDVNYNSIRNEFDTIVWYNR
jgi:hypothetical protein